MNNVNPLATPELFNALRASRQNDRKIIADALTEIAIKHGATVRRRHVPATKGYCGQGISLGITCHGVGAMIGVSDLHGGDWVLIHWYGTEDRARNFSSAFRIAVGNSDPRGHHKATSHPRNWNQLANMLDLGLRTAVRGAAFEPVTAEASAT